MNGISLIKLIAFLKRDFLIESSYKMAFLFTILGSVLPVFSFYFIAKSIDNGESEALTPYGGDYFPFVLVGVALTQYFMTALRSFADTVRRAQTAGVLEAILSTQTNPQAVILLTSVYSFVSSTIHVAIVFLVGGIFLGVDYSNANWPAALLAMVLAMASFTALGILSATAILILKKGDPVEWIVGSFSSLVGGALFPVSVLPDWMQFAGQLLPITYALEAMRMSIFQGQSISDLQVPIAVLAAMGLLLLPLSLFAFSTAVTRSRRDGTLMQY